MGILSSYGFYKFYSITDPNGTKIKLYTNPYFGKQDHEYLSFIESTYANRQNVFLSPDFKENIRSKSCILKYGNHLILSSYDIFKNIENAFIESLPQKIPADQIVNLLKAWCNPKLETLSQFDELEPAHGISQTIQHQLFRFKNDEKNPMRVHLTARHQMKWETINNNVTPLYIAKAINFCLEKHRKIHVNAGRGGPKNSDNMLSYSI